MLCGRCGYTNLDDAHYCVICGSELVQDTVAAHVDVGTVACPSCDFLNEEIATYCRNCGKKMKRRRRKVATKPVADGPSVEAEELLPVPLEPSAPSVQEEELAVLFGLGETEAAGGLAGELRQPLSAPGVVSTASIDDSDSSPPKFAEGEVPQSPDAATAGEIALEFPSAGEIGSHEMPITPEDLLLPESTQPKQLTSLSETPHAQETFAKTEAEATSSALPDGDVMVRDPDEMAKLIASIQSEEPAPAEASAETPEPDVVSPSAPDGDVMVRDPDEMAKLIASIQSEEPTPAEASAETPEPEAASSALPDGDGMVRDQDEMAKLIASIQSEEPAPAEVLVETPEPAVASSSTPDGDGMVRDPDEMAKLIASIQSEEPTSAEALGDAVIAPSDENASYVSTPHESVEATIADDPEGDDSTGDSDDHREAANIAAMAEITTTLNSLIKDLLEVEINEEGGRDSVDEATESDFPSPDPNQYPKKPAPRRRSRIRMREAVTYLVVTSTFLLSGMSIGLWVWYLFFPK